MVLYIVLYIASLHRVLLHIVILYCILHCFILYSVRGGAELRWALSYTFHIYHPNTWGNTQHPRTHVSNTRQHTRGHFCSHVRLIMVVVVRGTTSNATASPQCAGEWGDLVYVALRFWNRSSPQICATLRPKPSCRTSHNQHQPPRGLLPIPSGSQRLGQGSVRAIT